MGCPSKSRADKPRYIPEQRASLINQASQVESDISCTTDKGTKCTFEFITKVYNTTHTVA